MTYTLEWTCENQVESVNGNSLPANYFDDLIFDAPYKPLKRTIAWTTCGGVTKIEASSEEAAIRQLARTLRGPKKIRLV